MNFSDLIGEVFLILLFLGIIIGVVIADKIRRKN